jgi:hypothetical protein
MIGLDSHLQSSVDLGNSKDSLPTIKAKKNKKVGMKSLDKVLSQSRNKNLLRRPILKTAVATTPEKRSVATKEDETVDQETEEHLAKRERFESDYPELMDYKDRNRSYDPLTPIRYKTDLKEKYSSKLSTMAKK